MATAPCPGTDNLGPPRSSLSQAVMSATTKSARANKTNRLLDRRRLGRLALMDSHNRVRFFNALVGRKSLFSGLKSRFTVIITKSTVPKTDESSASGKSACPVATE
jgi:hypothetical protein